MTAATRNGGARRSRARYVYGIVPAATDLPDDQDGIGGGGLELLTHGSVAAVVESIGTDRTFGRREDLLAHSAVLNRLVQDGPVVPVRFGSVVSAGADVVEEVLAPNHDRFAGLLDDLTGRAQFTLRARYVEDVILREVIEEYPEVAALREQTSVQPEELSYNRRIRQGEIVARAIELKRSADSARIVESLMPHCVDYHVTEGAGADNLLDASFLVETGQRHAFEQAAEDAARQLRDRARLKLLGPLAPFDFVAGGTPWAS